MQGRGRPRRAKLAVLRAPLAVSLALVVVLLSLAGLVAVSDLRVSAALSHQSEALAADNAFTRARLAVAAETLAVRAVRADPSATNQRLLRNALGEVTSTMFTTLQASDLAGTVDEVRLSTLQGQLQVSAEQMIRLQNAGDPSANVVADGLVLPASAALQGRLDQVAEQYHAASRQQLDGLRQVLHRTLVAQATGGGLGALAVAGVLRLLWLARRQERLQALRSEHAALHDSLTGLPNRANFLKVLDEIVAEPPSQRRPVAVALIDLDDFKAINDSFGHRAGDDVLIAVATVLRSCVRPGDLVARLGGDEFIVVLRDRDDGGDVNAWARQTARALQCDVEIGQGTVAVSGSVGVTMLTPQDDAQTIAHRADLAMYHAKTTPGPGAWAGDPRTAAAPVATDVPLPAQLSTQLRTVMASGDPEGQLEHHYQLMVSATEGRVCGVEALTRWRHPQGGLLAPAQFLPVALAPSLRADFTRLVLLGAIRQLPLALGTLATHPEVRSDAYVSMNISADALASGIVHDLPGLLLGSGVAVGRVRVEISQLDDNSDLDALSIAIKDLRAAGIYSTLDNFTLGTTDLKALRSLAVDQIKIDGRSVDGFGGVRGPRGGRGADLGERLLGAVAALADGLDLRLAAHGAEDETTLDMLLAAGVSVVQGHHLAPPVPLFDLGRELLRMQQRNVMAVPTRAAAIHT